MKLESIINSELPPSRELPPGILKGNDYLNASDYLFRFVLSDTDPRWQIVSGFVQARREARFRPVHFENALLAIYLSDTPSYRNRYAAFSTAENIRQLCRAVNNVQAFPNLKQMYDATDEEFDLPEELKMEFARTDRIQMGTNELLRSKLRSIPPGKFFCEPFIPAASCEVFWFKNKISIFNSPTSASFTELKFLLASRTNL